MHIVDAMDKVLRLAKQAGYRIRQEWLGGSGGGGCEIRGQKFLFLDISLAPGEQFDQVLDTLKNDPNLTENDIPTELRPLFASSNRAKRKPAAVIYPLQNKVPPPATETSPATESAVRKFTTDGRRGGRKTA